MVAAERAFVNTVAQNVRAFLNIGLSLYSTRLVLKALGTMDYGVFFLVAGVVGLLGFLTNAMVVTTQRYLSYTYGQGDHSQVRQVFSDSYLLHLLLGIILVAVCVGLCPWLGHLNIDSSRLAPARWVYLLMVGSLFVTFVTAPYRALFIARENIVYISVVDVLDGFLKLGGAFYLFHLPQESRLVGYACIMLGIMFFNYAAQALYARILYTECCLLPRIGHTDWSRLRQLFSFAGWTIYSMGCIISRNQGMAVVLNHFFGTLINAAYGIAMQVSGAAQYVSQALLNALSPQIVKAEGRGDRQMMLRLSETTCRYAVLLFSLVVIPLVCEMPAILHLWLDEVPGHAVFFCRCVLLASLCDQFTLALGTANQAIGQIRNYSLAVNTIKLFTLPVAWILLKSGCPLLPVMLAYIALEALGAVIRLPFLHVQAGLPVFPFLLHVVGRSLPVVLLQFLAGVLCCLYVHVPLRFLITVPVCVVVGLLAVWLIGMEQSERQWVMQFLKRCFSKK